MRILQTIFLRKSACFEERHLSVCVEVALVSDKDDDKVGTGQSSRVRQPFGQRVVRLSAVHQQMLAQFCKTQFLKEKFHKNKVKEI